MSGGISLWYEEFAIWSGDCSEMRKHGADGAARGLPANLPPMRTPIGSHLSKVQS